MKKGTKKSRFGRPKVRHPKTERLIVYFAKRDLATLRRAAASKDVPLNEWARAVLMHFANESLGKPANGR